MNNCPHCGGPIRSSAGCQCKFEAPPKGAPEKPKDERDRRQMPVTPVRPLRRYEKLPEIDGLGPVPV